MDAAGPSKHDHSDQKATKKLLESLSQLSKTTKPTNKQTTPSRKQSTPTRKRSFKADNHPKITAFFNKENQGSKRRKNEVEAKPQPKPLDVTVKKEKKEKKASTSRSLKRNSSFDKYGIVLPSFEKIVADHKKFEEHKDSVKQLEAFDDGMLEVSLANDCLKENEFTGELLDCKDLSLEDLDAGFRRHLTCLKAIMSGEEFSQRHNIFHEKTVQVPISRDLKCSSSCAVFTHAQKEHLLELIEAELDPGNKLLGYIFKVLLPELCLLIFMDEHGMDKAEAVVYLDTRPLHFD